MKNLKRLYSKKSIKSRYGTVTISGTTSSLSGDTYLVGNKTLNVKGQGIIFSPYIPMNNPPIFKISDEILRQIEVGKRQDKIKNILKRIDEKN